MREIDLSKRIDNKVSPKYINAKQPMRVYHSTKELTKYEFNKDLIVIKNIYEFQKFIQEYGLVAANEFITVSDKNVWLATGEKYVPDIFSPNNAKTYILRNNKLIPTDNCYIRLYVIHSLSNRYLLFTSSGIFVVSISRWDLSAAIKPTFISVNGNTNSSYIPADQYKKRLAQILETNKVKVADIRMIHLLLNPMSKGTFLNPDGAAKEAYGYFVHKEDREKIFQTQKFRDLFMRELSRIMPDLKGAIQKKNNPDVIAEMLNKIASMAIESPTETVENKLTAVQAIINLGYPDDTDSSSMPFNPVSDKMLSAGENSKREELPATFQDEDKVKINSAKKQINSAEKEDEDLSEEKINEIRKEIGSSEMYINDGKSKY